MFGKESINAHILKCKGVPSPNKALLTLKKGEFLCQLGCQLEGPYKVIIEHMIEQHTDAELGVWGVNTERLKKMLHP